jgi:hypothetical protein
MEGRTRLLAPTLPSSRPGEQNTNPRGDGARGGRVARGSLPVRTYGTIAQLRSMMEG